MGQFKREYYRNGESSGQRVDILVDIKTPDRKKVRSWSAEQRAEAIALVNESEAIFRAFANEVRAALSEPAPKLEEEAVEELSDIEQAEEKPGRRGRRVAKAEEVAEEQPAEVMA